MKMKILLKKCGSLIVAFPLLNGFIVKIIAKETISIFLDKTNCKANAKRKFEVKLPETSSRNQWCQFFNFLCRIS
jgi:hypothetical protein